MPQYKIKAKIWSTKNDENNRITLIIDTLKPYKISIHEIEYLKKEINTARIHIEQINNNFDNEIRHIELEKNKLLSKNHENKERQIEDARNKYRHHYENYINYDTYTNMIFNRNKHREIKDKFDHARYELESAELHANMNYDDEKKKLYMNSIKN